MTGSVSGAHQEMGSRPSIPTSTVSVAEKVETSFQSQMPYSKLAVFIHVQRKSRTHDAWQAAGKHQINIDLSDATGQKSWCALWGFRSVILPERRPPLLVVKEARAVSLAKRLGGAGDGSAS